jgi:hypothetical protein
VRLNRLVPELRHRPSIRECGFETL